MRIAKSAADLGFTWSDRRRLTKAMQEVADKRTYRRLRAVFLVASGRAISEVAQIVGASLKTIYNWIACYLAGHRPEALREAPRRGRPLLARRVTAGRIRRELQRNPLRLGDSTTVWTVALLAHHLSQKYECLITARTLRRRMKERGLRWKRPRYLYSQKDPHRAQKRGYYPPPEADANGCRALG